MYNYLNYQKENEIGILTLNRPPVNALCNDMVEELDRITKEIEDDHDIRALIITGAGDKAFMAGADIKELKDRSFILGRYQTKKRQEVFNRIADCHVPTIAAINGFALGAGFELALSCSIRIGSDDSKYGSPEVNLGIIPGDGATQRLPKMVGLSRAMYMILTGDVINADEALNYGLIIRKVPSSELLSCAKEFAEKITSKAPLAIQYAKEAVNRSLDVSLSVGLVLESYLHALSCASEDKNEGVNAFIEKRKPSYQGK
jgi:enoyl-CoA hydratase